MKQNIDNYPGSSMIFRNQKINKTMAKIIFLPTMYHLYIKGRMFSKEDSRTDFRGTTSIISFLQIPFIVKSKKDSPEGPVVAQFDLNRDDLNLDECIEALEDNGFMEESLDDMNKILSKYAPELKTTPAIMAEL